jgi:hypothetical protein
MYALKKLYSVLLRTYILTHNVHVKQIRRKYGYKPDRHVIPKNTLNKIGFYNNMGTDETLGMHWPTQGESAMASTFFFSSPAQERLHTLT